VARVALITGITGRDGSYLAELLPSKRMRAGTLHGAPANRRLRFCCRFVADSGWTWAPS